MQLDFLEAAAGVPLTKTFVKSKDGTLDTDPYPFIRDVTSHRFDVTTVEELHKVLVDQAQVNRCLLKGLVDRELHNESRAGHTNSDALTHWVLLDLDFEDGWESVDDFIAELNPLWANTSYVFQHSASAGVKYTPGLRGHVWIMLDSPMPPAMLKQWLRERNLDVPRLKERCALASNAMSLRRPLDITTCQNDKLIYIAAPVCVGFEDPIAGQRFRLVPKQNERGAAPSVRRQLPAIEAAEQELVDTLRQAQGLPKRKPQIKAQGALAVLQNPDSATVTGVKVARGFVYVNLNGGDSWGYYFPENKPELLFNFKGEPVVQIKKIAPDFYQSYTTELNTKRHGDIQPYVFREPNRDAYFNLLYSPSDDELKLIATAGSKDKLSDFMAQYGRSLPEPVEDWTLEFDPTSIKVIDPKARWVNLYNPTIYVRHAARLTKATHIPPTINKVIHSFCGSDAATVNRFLNWLAYVFQTRKPANTAWIFHGVQGTGKGIFLSKVLRPLLGDQHVLEWTTQSFEEQFNAPLERTLILWLDEFHASSSAHANTVMNKLKAYITEPVLTIRGMRQNSIQVKNFLSVIVASNHPDPVQLPEHDRRFNVAPAQERPLVLTQREVDNIDDELPTFASFLQNFTVNQDFVRKVEHNDAHTQMVAASQTTQDRFFAALRKGDLDWFLDFMEEAAPLSNIIAYQEYEKAMVDWCQQYLADTNGAYPARISHAQVRAAYDYIIATPTTPAKFSRICNIQRVVLRPVRKDGGIIKAFEVSLTSNDDERVQRIANRKDKPELKLVKT